MSTVLRVITGLLWGSQVVQGNSAIIATETPSQVVAGELTDTERFLLQRLEAANAEVRRQVQLRSRQISGSCSDRAGLAQLAGDKQSLRVGSYNLWNLNHNWPLRQQGIQSMLRYLQTDIIAVQEIRWLPGQEWPAAEPEDENGEHSGPEVQGNNDDAAAESASENGEDNGDDSKPSPCALDQYVRENMCHPCPPHEYKEAGDDPEGPDTQCHVRYKANGDDPRLDDREPQLVSLASAAGYGHYTLRSAAAAARSIGANWTAPGGFDEEAVGILSLHPIIDTAELPLPPPWDAPDRNPRVVLAPTINVTQIGPVRVLSAHLSYEKGEQCRTVPILRNFANKLWKEDLHKYGRIVPQLLMGDLNIYFDFEWPTDFLTEPQGHMTSSPTNPCATQFASAALDMNSNAEGDDLDPIPPFSDAWEQVKPASDRGYSFPNPETSNSLPPARCDRILTRGFDLLPMRLEPKRAAVLGCEPLGMSGTYMSDHRFVVSDLLPLV